MNWKERLQNCLTTDELKSAYRQLAKIFHPDLGGDTEIMKQINLKFEELFNRLIRGEKPNREQKYYDWQASVTADVREAIDRIIALPEIEIEICGLWVWVTGNTRPVKDALKAADYKWAFKKSAWFYAGCESSGRGNCSLDDIRNNYGSEKVNTLKRQHLDDEAAA